MKPLKWYLEDWYWFFRYYFRESYTELKNVFKSKLFWIVFFISFFVYFSFKSFQGFRFVVIIFFVILGLFFYTVKARSGGMYRHEEKEKRMKMYREKATETQMAPPLP